MFAIINSSKSIDGQIFFAFQRSDKDNNVEVINMYGNRPKSEGFIQIQFQINGLKQKWKIIKSMPNWNKKSSDENSIACFKLIYSGYRKETVFLNFNISINI